jgi:UDP-N-acetylmuramoyl-L-alanyl-D-glutamate--2,6-diaminopimelate ligase
VHGLRESLGELAAEFYGRPSEQLLTIGVTGTNGKTSCSHWIAQLLTNDGRRCAIVGTVGIGFTAGPLKTSALTTPDPVSLQRQVRELLDAGAQALAMEVSSIGLTQGRVSGMKFDVALFTNLTRDHLDFHGGMERYEAAKALLFERPLGRAVINLDDAAGRRLAACLLDRDVRTIGFSAADADPVSGLDDRLVARAIRATGEGLSFVMEYGQESTEIKVPLVGHYNVENLLGVVGVALACGIPFARAVQALPRLVPPAGRMQSIVEGVGPLAIVDYAHTPDALTKALAALRPLVSARGGRLWAVLGAGGDRDPGKRAPMGAAAAAGAEVVVVTSDNPRSEDPASIVAQVAAGAAHAPRLLSIVDRAEAIARALREAEPSDVVLIAGKGHENYQIIGAETRAFSDAETARRVLAERAGAQACS